MEPQPGLIPRRRRQPPRRNQPQPWTWPRLRDLRFRRARPSAPAAVYMLKVYNVGMEYEWDVLKSESNREKHGVRFDVIAGFDWVNAVVKHSDRHHEERYAATGRIGGGRLCTVAYTLLGDTIRIISIRPASRREVREYANS